MLSVHAREAERSKQRLQAQMTATSRRVQQAAHRLSDALLLAVNSNVSEAYATQRLIETEMRALERVLATTATQAHQWATLVSRLSTELKEMGDVAHWAHTLRQTASEIRDISHTLSSI